jgi:uncharacterized protein YndB with AHSA1/START domain
MSRAFATPEIAVEMRGFIRKAGGETTWDRLAEYLGKRVAGKELFFIARTFEAPIDLVYDMWVQSEHMAQWLPPTGATMRFHRFEPQPGHSSFYEMTFTGGEPMYGLVKYVELIKPTRLVYTQQFCDANESVIRPPFFSNWPLKMRTTVELTAESELTTRVTVRWEPEDATTEDIAEFVKQRTGMTGGWTGSFDKLDTLLELVVK